MADAATSEVLARVVEELEALRVRNDRLEQEVAALKREAASPETGGAGGRYEDAPVSRRHLLKHVGGAAAAGVGLAVAGSVLRAGPAAASTNMQAGGSNDAGTAFTTLTSSNG